MFVELCPSLLVDPTEVSLVSGTTTAKTRVYLKGNGGLSWLEVDRPIHEVLAVLDQGTAPASPTRDGVAS